jgi:hypothetical protein
MSSSNKGSNSNVSEQTEQNNIERSNSADFALSAYGSSDFGDTQSVTTNSNMQPTDGALHSRQMRANRTNMIQNNIRAGQNFQQTFNNIDRRTEQVFHSINQTASYYKSSLKAVVDMSLGPKVAINLKIFSNEIICTVPTIHSFYCQPSSIEHERFIFIGLAAVSTFYEGFHAFCVHAVHVKHHNLAEKLIFSSKIKDETFVVEGQKASASFEMSTVNAILCGAKSEIRCSGWFCSICHYQVYFD